MTRQDRAKVIDLKNEINKLKKLYEYESKNKHRNRLIKKRYELHLIIYDQKLAKFLKETSII